MKSSENRSILLVDDEQDIRDVLAISLADLGYEVLEAENGTKAMELFAEHKPVIVLTDIKMPGMDGIEILKKIKQSNPYAQVIMITGHGDMDTAVDSLKNGAIDFITKPISSTALEIALQRANDNILTRNKLNEYTQNLEKLVQEKTELQDNLSTLGTMIGSISHNIKGLLTKLEGGIYLIDSAGEKKDSALLQEGMDILRLNINQLKKMIFDILYYSKERTIEPEEIDLKKFAREVSDVAQQKIGSHDIRIVHHLDDAPGFFKADPAHMRSAFINILDNAVDACLEDFSKKRHKINFTGRQDKANIIFEIHDNGIGMDKATMDKIFNLLFSSKQNKGTGFGLFISKNIIQQHGGDINVKSAKAKGTCITVKMPKKID